MNRIQIITCLIFVVAICFCNAGLKAQDAQRYESLTPEDYSDLSLPPLDVLFENAKNAPSYELSLVEEEVERRLLAREKRAILGFFSVRGSWQYGTFANDGYLSTLIQEPVYSYTKTDQTLYSVGASVNIPLDQLFDLGPRIRRQKLQVRAAELRREERFELVQKEIVALYAQALSQINILKLRSEAVILANEKYKILEKGFTNGTVDFSVLATEKENQSMTIQRYEDSKFELNKCLMTLEIITRTPIIRK